MFIEQMTSRTRLVRASCLDFDYPEDIRQAGTISADNPDPTHAHLNILLSKTCGGAQSTGIRHTVGRFLIRPKTLRIAEDLGQIALSLMNQLKLGVR